MSHQRRGKRLETGLCQSIYAETDGQLIAEPIGYSGNHAVPAPDLRIDDGDKVYAFELKTTSKDRVSLYYEPDDTARDDIDQLLTYAHTYPRTVVPYVGVKFTNRQLLALPLWLGAPNNVATVRSATNTAPADVPVSFTHAENISVQKPTLEQWPSAQAGDDTVYLLDEIGYR